MPRKIFKRWMPSPSSVRENPALEFLGALRHDPNLFHLTRHSVSVAFFVGLFIAFLPIPFQIPLAAAGALLFRCNLPLACTLVWVSNPLTFPIIFYGCYVLGARLLNTPESSFNFELSFEWFQSEFLMIWQPLVLGCVLSGLFFGCLGYISMQWIWRWHVVTKWKSRKKRRQLKEKM